MESSPTTRYAHNALDQWMFKTEPVYLSASADAGSGLMAFFTRLWSGASSSVSDADRLGFAYVYDDEGTLMGEYGAGGAKSAGSRQYIWLPTPAGPMPVASVQNQTTLQAITADHLNTPRRLTSADGTLLWQWPVSMYGEEPPEVLEQGFKRVPAVEGDLTFNLRFPGQYFDKESGLHYNGFRTYDPMTGRYTQADPIGLNGGWNRFGYVGGNPLKYVDRFGLAIGDFPPPPPGYDSGSWTRGAWPNNSRTYLRDPSGNTWTIHPEDKGHWRHWDKQDSDGDDDGTWPPNGKKPWSGQKKLKDGQCETDPSGDAKPWDPAKYDYTPDNPQLWVPQWANPRSSITPRYSPLPRLIPRFILP